MLPAGSGSMRNTISGAYFCKYRTVKPILQEHLLQVVNYKLFFPPVLVVTAVAAAAVAATYIAAVATGAGIVTSSV